MVPLMLWNGHDLWQQVKADWQLLKYQRCLQDIANNEKDNKTRIYHNYKVGDLVLIVENFHEHEKKPKHTQGPYEIMHVHMNGTMCIHCVNYGKTSSICHLCPYRPND